MISPMDELARGDVQGLVMGGHGKMAAARFLLLEVDDAERARAYLRRICGPVTRADEVAEVEALQVAFTAAGLAALEIPRSARESFSREFKEGMDEPVRAVSLGDQGDNAPRHWTWGRTRSEPQEPQEPPQHVHVLLLLYARDEVTLARWLTDELAELGGGAFRVVAEKPTRLLRESKEHFGWKDGISTPILETRKSPQWTCPIQIGEFVLGYQNEYKSDHQTYPESPTVELADDPGNLLAATRDGTRKDLGRNGSYLVYREITQNVLEFWDYLETSTRAPGADPVVAATELGAKMVGRWPGGAPLINSRGEDDPQRSEVNSFGYANDQGGLQCPLGAHIRRANPRDDLAADRDAADSTEMVRKHQMLRRGRPFGEPVVDSMEPREILAMRGKPDGVARGLHFICLVAHIGRQFEFVQRAWLNSANFHGLFKDTDPLVGTRRRPPDENASDEFTCPAVPVRRKYKDLPQFTRVVGGAYFFLPSIRALRFISRDP